MIKFKVIARMYRSCQVDSYIISNNEEITEVATDELRQMLASGKYISDDIELVNGKLRQPRRMELGILEYIKELETLLEQFAVRLGGYIMKDTVPEKGYARYTLFNGSTGAVTYLTVLRHGKYIIQSTACTADIPIYLDENTGETGVIFQNIPNTPMALVNRVSMSIKFPYRTSKVNGIYAYMLNGVKVNRPGRA